MRNHCTPRKCSCSCPHHFPTLIPNLLPHIGWTIVGSQCIQYVSDLLNEAPKVRIKMWKTAAYFTYNSNIEIKIGFWKALFLLPGNRNHGGREEKNGQTCDKKLSLGEGSVEARFGPDAQHPPEPTKQRGARTSQRPLSTERGSHDAPALVIDPLSCMNLPPRPDRPPYMPPSHTHFSNPAFLPLNHILHPLVSSVLPGGFCQGFCV